jgi:tRNA A-37 threonylcarbamoyl transferase component Bud32
MQYNRALEALSNIHACGIIHGDFGPPDSTTDSSSLIIAEPSDDPVFVDFFLGYYDRSNPSAFKGEMSSLHVLFLWLSKGNGKALLEWAATNMREELRRKPHKRDRL